jgi:hypothetical protein
MYSVYDTLAGGLPHSDIHGSTPARGSPWLFAACHVLHRLLVPRHPPNALLILDIPVWAIKTKPHHAQKPSSGYKDDLLEILCFPHTTRSSQTAVSLRCLRNPKKDPSDKIVHRASEPSLSNRWGAIHSTRANNNSRSDNSAEQRDPQPVRRPISSHTRPETHQNLIHSNKEQHDRSTGAADQTAQSHTRDALPRHMIKPNSNIRDTDQSQPACSTEPSLETAALIVCKQTIAAVRGQWWVRRLRSKRQWWRQSGSNR